LTLTVLFPALLGCAAGLGWTDVLSVFLSAATLRFGFTALSPAPIGVVLRRTALFALLDAGTAFTAYVLALSLPYPPWGALVGAAGVAWVSAQAAGVVVTTGTRGVTR
jgi:hypothetical protein